MDISFDEEKLKKIADEAFKHKKEKSMDKNTLENFILGTGALVEMWVFVFGQFKANGFSEKDALKHTQAYISMVLGYGNKNTENNKEEN